MKRAARSAAVAAAASIAAGLSACAPQVRLSTPDTHLPAAFESGGAAANAGLNEASLDRWWTLFDDPQLNGLVEQAITASPDAKAALGRLQEARAVRAATLAQFLPQGELQGSASDQGSQQTITAIGGVPIPSGAGVSFFGPSGQLQSYSLSFNPTWELDLFGKNRALRRSANADYAAARFDYEATRISLAAGVAQSLFQARGLAAQLADTQDNLRIARSLADVTGKREAHGLGTSADTARLVSQVRTLEAQATQSEALLRTTRRSLLVLTGHGADPLDTVPIEARLPAPPQVPASTPGELLARRPDVREAELRLESATQTAKADRRALFPTFTLMPGGSLTKTMGAYDSFSTLWQVGVGAALPVLDRPRLLADLRAQTARGEQAVAAYEKAVQSAYSDAENGLTTLQSDETRLGLLSDAEARARFAYQANDTGYRAGLIDLTTVLQVEQSWLTARASLTAARSTALQDAVTTFKALGGGWTPSAPAQTAASGARAR